MSYFYLERVFLHIKHKGIYNMQMNLVIFQKDRMTFLQWHSPIRKLPKEASRIVISPKKIAVLHSLKMYTFEYLLIFLSPAKDDRRIFSSETLFKWNIWIWILYLANIIAKIVYVRKHKSKFDILNGIMEFGYSHLLPRGAFLRNHCLWVLGWKYIYFQKQRSPFSTI